MTNGVDWPWPCWRRRLGEALNFVLKIGAFGDVLDVSSLDRLQAG